MATMKDLVGLHAILIGFQTHIIIILSYLVSCFFAAFFSHDEHVQTGCWCENNGIAEASPS
jgi:hypothetical protein